jgi:hypothetical protein
MGVAVSFLGSLIDNFYWAIPWAMDYAHHPDTMWWIKTGAYFNIFDRQIAGIIAAYCHMRAAIEFTDDKHTLNDLTKSTLNAICVGVLLIGYLTYLRFNNV